MASHTSNLSPRQKMINLMYIVLTAMLALNVSSDVLNGFQQVEEGLVRTTDNVAIQNGTLYDQLTSYYQNNPEKSGEWYRKAVTVRQHTDSLYDYISSLKQRIVWEADGKKGDVNNIVRQDDLEAASFIMLSPTTREGRKLRESLISYSEMVNEMIDDTLKQQIINEYLYPRMSKKDIGEKKTTWEEANFENMPVIAAITLLTKIQSDLRSAESEILHTLLNNIDKDDVRVNQLNAYVIPSSKTVIRGGKYSANIVLAAIDTTMAPIINIDGMQLTDSKDGLYEVLCNRSGVYDVDGFLEVRNGDGSSTHHPFHTSYTVVDPSATVSATMMNVLYAGIDNPLSISVPGGPNQSVSATATGGKITRTKDNWQIRPAKVGENVVITVTAAMDGKNQVVNTTTFRVRQLPDPMPFIAYKDDNGNAQRYKGGKPFAKSLLLAAPGIEAAIDDDLLNVEYTVLSFETVFFDSMGNAIPEVSDGNKFSQRQKDSFRRLSRGKRFYISRVRAVGPDGVERDLSPIEIIVN
ncbi:MAG: gliding motility protein GldM [Porphyromonadaceae bacterium]|nr:gliding motility protein GldM [Porphyromonadaceae bacterium]